ncbi:MAG TPA: CoA transferase [Ktedonobacterales bacterium]|nr:CoA transferase [Ktedonobacterales bacterium]
MAPEDRDSDTPRRDDSARTAPLAGVRVVEFGSFVAAPTTTRILADFGAEVIKVEPPGSGDELRQWGEMIPTRDGALSAWWLFVARNKRLITLNLRDPRGQALALRLIAKSDIVVENFRPGRMEGWNLGYEQMRAVNPRVVLVRISGYGQTGPYRERAGYGNVSESMGGLRYVTGFPDRPPVRVGVSLGDTLAAQQAAFGALLALRVAEHTGKGQVVDVAITEAVFAVTEGMLTEYAHKEVVRERTGNKLLRAAPSNVYATGDGKWLAIGGNGENVFRRFTQALGAPELAQDPRFMDNRARVAHHDELDDIISEWTGARTLAEAREILDEAGVPAGPVMSIADIADDPQYQARGMIARTPDERMEAGEVVLPGIVPRLSATPGAISHSGGDLGADTASVMTDLLGLEGDELDRLVDARVVGAEARRATASESAVPGADANRMGQQT